MPVIPLGFAQVNFQFNGAGAPHGAETTLGIDLVGFAGTAAELAETMANLWASSDMALIQSADITLFNVHAKFGPSSTGASGDFATSVTGTQPAANTPNTSWLINKNTADGGRSGRGRMYIPGIYESSVGPGGEIAGATVTAAQGHVDDWYDAMIAAEIGPTVLHGPGAPISAPSFITSFTVQSLCATQRRRMRR